MIVQAARPDLGAYRRFVVAFSGGKDSLAALQFLLNLGVLAHAIELHHHDIDGRGPTFMDWPCTAGYSAIPMNWSRPTTPNGEEPWTLPAGAFGDSAGPP